MGELATHKQLEGICSPGHGRGNEGRVCLGAGGALGGILISHLCEVKLQGGKVLGLAQEAVGNSGIDSDRKRSNQTQFIPSINLFLDLTVIGLRLLSILK